MSENTKPTPQNDEVDLAQLFKMIGNALQKLYDFIVSIFKGLFRVLLLILAHFYKRAKWYAIAAFVGLVAGYFMDKSSEKLYYANMLIKTNFDSAFQVYENIKNLHKLAKVEKDTVKLAEILDIDVSDAASLNGFYIEPDKSKAEEIEKFSTYFEALDSLTKTTTTFTDYQKGIRSYDYKKHQIGVISLDKSVYNKIRNSFVQAISKNSYLDELLDVNQKNLDSHDSTLVKQEKNIDKLVQTYIDIRINEANKEITANSGTNFYLGNAQKTELLVEEAPLIKEKLELASQRRKINKDKVEMSSIVSILSDFPETGYDIQEWHQKNRFRIPVLLLALTLIGFIFIGLGKYLNKEGLVK